MGCVIGEYGVVRSKRTFRVRISSLNDVRRTAIRLFAEEQVIIA